MRSLSPSRIRTWTRMVSPGRNSGCFVVRACLLMNLLTSAFCILGLPHFARFDQVGPKPLGFFARRSPAPALDLFMISAQQRFGHFPAAKFRGPGVLWAI